MRRLGEKTIKILIDTRAAKNYVKLRKGLKGVVPVEKPFTVSSVHGSSNIGQKCLMKVFGQVSPFYISDTLSSFDAIIGFDLLARVKISLHLQEEGTLTYLNKSDQLKYHKCESVNFTDVDDTEVPTGVKKKNSRL